MSEKRMKVMITLGVTIFVIIITILVLLINYDNNEETKKVSNNSVESSYDTLKGIIVDINDDKTIYSIRDYNNIKEVAIAYKPGCTIKNRYGKEIYHDKLNIGDVVTIGYKQSISNVKYIYIDSDILQYKGLKNYYLDNNTYYIKLDDKKYRLKKETFVYRGNKESSIYDLHEEDILTLNIKDKDVVSVVVEKGHSFVELSNYDAFLGYSLIVNDDKSYEISENLKIVVPEGKNQFVIKNEKYTGNITLVNLADNTDIIDIKKIRFEKRKEGSIKFYVEPENARLYISGKSYNYKEPIVLDYGKYNYSVESAGYYALSDYFIINSDEKKLSVYLQEKLNTKKPESTKKTSDSKEDSDLDEDNTEENVVTIQPTSTAEISN